jgi:integrase
MTDGLEAWIQSFNAGSIWFGKLDSQNTKRTYLPHFKRYSDWAKKNPDELIQLKIEGLQHINTPSEFQAEDLLEKFLSTSDFTLAMKDGIRTAVISFYRNNRRNLVEVKDIETPEAKKRCPTASDIVDLENAMTTARDKFLVWFIASSPVRLETLTKLVWADLKPTNDREVPYSFIIESARLKGAGRSKYKGLKHIGFLHSLAVKKLEAYKKELEKKEYVFADSNPKKEKHIITPKSPIFLAYRKELNVVAFGSNGIEHKFDDASQKAWHDLEQKRYSPHDFRDFVQSALENAGITSSMIAPFLGHKVKGIDASYSQHTIDELLLRFKQALPFLLPQTVEKVKSELDQTKQELTKAETELDDTKRLYQNQIDELKKSIEGLYHIQKTYPITLEHSLINKKTGKMETYTETVNNPQEQEESIRKFQEKTKKLSESDKQ